MRMLHYLPVHIVLVIMVVRVERNLRADLFAEQLQKCGVGAHYLRFARATDVPIQAQHGIGGGHHQVQIVGNHQHRTAMTMAHRVDQRRTCGGSHRLGEDLG